MFNIFTSVSLGQCCGLKTHTDKWAWCLKEGALCCIPVRNLRHKLHSPLCFQLKARILEETDGLSPLIHGFIAGVSATVWGFWQCNGLCSTRDAGIRWESFSTREESLCSGSSRALQWMWWGRGTVPGLSLASWGMACKGPGPLSAVLATLEHTCSPWDSSGSKSQQENTKETCQRNKGVFLWEGWIVMRPDMADFCVSTELCWNKALQTDLWQTSARAVSLSILSKKKKNMYF